MITSIVSPQGSTATGSTTAVSASGWIGSAIGPLSTRELGALRAATGTNFAWPPTATSGVPLAALDVAGRHADEMAAGMKLKEMNAESLRQLGATGLLDPAGVTRGIAYLRDGQSPTLRTPPPQTTPAKPISGCVAADGSVYL